jgi:hypothetical protein
LISLMLGKSGRKKKSMLLQTSNLNLAKWGCFQDSIPIAMCAVECWM